MNITFEQLSLCIGKSIGSQPFCIETGASYTRLPEDEVNLKNTSTYNIVWNIAKPNNGILWTYDNSANSLEICRKGLKEDSCYWKGILGDSVEQLSNSSFPKSIDFVHLDSVEGDEDYMVREFLALESFLSENAIICCDDIHNPSSVKWKKAVPLIKNKAHRSLEVSTGLGTFLAFMGNSIIESIFDICL